MVMDRGGNEDYAGVRGHERGFTDKKVSDQCTAWEEFYGDKDGDG